MWSRNQRPIQFGIHGSGHGVATPPRESSSLMVVLLFSVSGRPTPRKSIPSSFKPESATLQSGTILGPGFCWQSEGLAEKLQLLGTEKPTDSNGAERSKIRTEAEFGETILIEKLRRNIERMAYRRSYTRTVVVH